MNNQHILIILLLVLICQKSWSQLETNRWLSVEERNQDMPLSVGEAFPYHVSVVNPHIYLITWNLAPGHYLYGHAFEFKLIQGTDNLVLPIDFQLPQGLKKSDEFFGDVEAFYGDISINLTLPTAATPEAQIIIEYQGCADWGFCYPHQSESLPLKP